MQTQREPLCAGATLATDYRMAEACYRSAASMEEEDFSDVLLLYAYLWSRKEKLKRMWVHDINKNRKRFGEYHYLVIELFSHEDKY